MTITDSLFENNTADKGGAIYNTGTLHFAGTNTFKGNNATEGNDIYNVGSVTVESGAKKGDAKKIMSLMMLGAKKEHTLSFTVEGEDEEACAAALEAFLKENL
jgi:predicted outer membrane repeat protein